MKIMRKIAQVIKKCQRFLITSHVHPDPDAVCSEMALALTLKAMGKTATIVNNEPTAERFHFLPKIKDIKTLAKVKKVPYDAIFILDCGELDRIGGVTQLLEKGKPIINIDHHVTNSQFGDYNLVKPEASSTAEVLYDLIAALGCPLTDAIALHLYAGIMTDTGSFRYENTKSRTHSIVSELRKFKFSAHGLYSKFYEMMPLEDIRLFMKVTNRFETFFNDRVICVELKKKIVEGFSKDFDLRDTMFKFLRAIQGVEVVVIFTEFKKHVTRVNFRSSDRVNVAKIAQHFDGGGHSRASGCLLDLSMEQSKKRVLNYIKGVL